MGGAIARGLAQGDLVQTSDITVSNPSSGKLERLKAEFPALQVTTDNREASREADLLILAVKPWLMEQVIREIAPRQEQVLVSVAAVISFDKLEQMAGQAGMAMYRVIPNTAIGLMESMTLLAHNRHTTPEQDRMLTDIFNQMGLAMMLPEEKMGAATAMTSCGIAYVLKYIQAAMQAGIELGIYPKDGMKMVAQSVKGAAELILAGDTHPAVEIDKVCTPGGITIRGVNELEHAGFTSAVIRAIKESNG